MLDRYAPHRRWWLYLLIGVAALGLWPHGIGHGLAKAFAQETAATSGAPAATSAADPAATPTASSERDKPAGSTVQRKQDEGVNFFALIISGGWLMIPIGFMSLLSTVVVIERFLALRNERVLPSGLVQELGRLGGSQGAFDPREAYRICQRYPSTTANVVRAMLLRVGRPHSEVEHTVAEASEREADRLYSRVRWLNLAAGVTPMIGLLGTVWGMIEAFHSTTLLAPGENKALQLATGIYIALVTTYGGLMVAIPSAICAHYFEGRIQSHFHQIDEMLFNLLPQIERYEGRMRFGHRDTVGQEPLMSAEPPVVAPPSPSNF
jgi:biopolymer transport protein ExbB